jgi:hypothetical protein
LKANPLAKFFLVLSGLAMVLFGGCSILFATSIGPSAFVIGGLPFIAALGIFVLSKSKISEKRRKTGSFTLDRVKPKPKR